MPGAGERSGGNSTSLQSIEPFMGLLVVYVFFFFFFLQYLLIVSLLKTLMINLLIPDLIPSFLNLLVGLHYQLELDELNH